MRIGKLSGKELKDNVLDVIKKRRPEVLLGAQLGEDCASFKSEDILLVSSDPITGADKNIGRLAIQVASNDIVAGGGEPFMAIITIIAPPDTKVEKFREIMNDAENEAERLNIEIAGGHTEFSDAVNKVIISATVIGKANKHMKATQINVGDTIIVTKNLGLEGTVILADKYKDLLELSDEEKNELLTYVDSLSVSEEGKKVVELTTASMHDITEGGIFGAVSEICESVGIGAEIMVAELPFTRLTNRITEQLSIDKYRLLSSGSLLIITSSPKLVLDGLSEIGVKATVIGVVKGNKPIAVYEDGQREELTVLPDSIMKSIVEQP